VEVILDTGSADLWVFDDAYEHVRSSTYQADGGQFEIRYADGSEIKGSLSRDKLDWAGLVIPDQTFAEIDPKRGAPDFWVACHEQGILGMALDALAHSDAFPPFHHLVDSGLVPRPIFAFFLVDDVGGVLTLGGTDPAHYRGELRWFPVQGANDDYYFSDDDDDDDDENAARRRGRARRRLNIAHGGGIGSVGLGGSESDAGSLGVDGGSVPVSVEATVAHAAVDSQDALLPARATTRSSSEEAAAQGKAKDKVKKTRERRREPALPDVVGPLWGLAESGTEGAASGMASPGGFAAHFVDSLFEDGDDGTSEARASADLGGSGGDGGGGGGDDGGGDGGGGGVDGDDDGGDDGRWRDRVVDATQRLDGRDNLQKWEINLRRVTVGAAVVGAARTAVLDTGSTYITAPAADFVALAAALRATCWFSSSQHDDHGFVERPCAAVSDKDDGLDYHFALVGCGAASVGFTFADGWLDGGGSGGALADGTFELADAVMGPQVCGGGEFLDCLGGCLADEHRSWVGDGVCDGGANGFSLNCAAFQCDGGDCRDQQPCKFNNPGEVCELGEHSHSCGPARRLYLFFS
jgi:hypothetical protein